MFSLSKEIEDKRNALTIAEKGSANLDETKKENDELEKKSAELEKKFPRLVETTLLIDTLKDITEESKLKFASIEPLPQIDHELKGQKDFYMELPIKVRLNCNFEDAIKFIQKIESSSRLMKIREFSIKSNPQDVWEHNVVVIISTFSIGKK
jgi:Tfp pilus assembly protein PilO